MRRVVKTPGCWLWTGAVNGDGYGVIRGDDGRMQLVHRIVYRRHVGPLDPELEVDHKCVTRNCVRPRHLEQVTHAENMKRAVTRRLQRAA